MVRPLHLCSDIYAGSGLSSGVNSSLQDDTRCHSRTRQSPSQSENDKFALDHFWLEMESLTKTLADSSIKSYSKSSRPQIVSAAFFGSNPMEDQRNRIPLVLRKTLLLTSRSDQCPSFKQLFWLVLKTLYYLLNRQLLLL